MKKRALHVNTIRHERPEAGEGYQVRESPASYNALFEAKKEDIGPENTYFWNVSL